MEIINSKKSETTPKIDYDPVFPVNCDLHHMSAPIPEVLPNYIENVKALRAHSLTTNEPTFSVNEFIYAMRVANGDANNNDKLFQTYTTDYMSYRERFMMEILNKAINPDYGKWVELHELKNIE